ncbi:hypothetical protein JX085_003429 [Vibrio cholerae]|nr:hypothetical protein [Vibrio cholerae]EJL6503437.1 hypothetical protein [Vibrio cholerae]
MQEREKYENGLFTIRFIGDDLDKRGVSIYDLGESLIAFQRIINKAYLAQEDRLVKGAFPSSEERQHLALQIGQRKRASDGFSLIPILADPHTQQAMLKVADWVISGVIGYYVGDVIQRLKNENDPNKRIFISSIFKEVSTIVNRIGTSGGVSHISIGSPVKGQETVVAFDRETKNYLVDLSNETYLGAYQEIYGKVYKFYPASKIVVIRRVGGSTVNVFLNESDFDEIRYCKDTNPFYTFKGHPVYKMGVETKSVTDFDAESIEYREPDA